MRPEYELVYGLLINRGAAEIINPMAVIQDMHSDLNGDPAKRLRGLWYARDNEGRRYPMTFSVDRMPYASAIEASVVQHFAQIDGDACAPYLLQEQYQLIRDNSCPCRTLQLLPQKCFKHRLQVPVMITGD